MLYSVGIFRTSSLEAALQEILREQLQGDQVGCQVIQKICNKGKVLRTSEERKIRYSKGRSLVLFCV